MPPRSKGEQRTVSFDMQQAVRMLRLDTFGSDLAEQTHRSAAKLVYRDEVLEVDKGEVTQYRRRFETATETVNDSNVVVLPLHGKTIVVDRRSGKPQITWEDGNPVTGSLIDAIKEGKDMIGNMASFEPLPDHPVKVGDSWNIDVSAIVKECEAKHGCKLTGATGIGTLKEINQSAAGPRAKVEVRIRVPLRTIQGSEHELDLSDGSGTTLDAIYEFALGNHDNFYASAMQMKFLATGTNPESNGTSTRLRIELTVDLKEQRQTAR
jgi:hypothetical protein